ncbi:MAG TPA: class I SAM-dependent methyltransferase [Dehalococcoidia bacterium]|nr:class I SAM-dependent methyltransferase [Dehalococcoidia bacterium]
MAFDAVPEIYDRVRPSYPDALFDELFSHFSGNPGVLEIGPGTGQATRSLLARGARVTAAEPGPQMAGFLRQKLAGEHRLAIINAKFEDISAAEPFDIVFAATSFHWVDRAVRLQKAHDALRPGGALAIVSTNQVRSRADRGYFDACQPIYQKYFPDEERTVLQTPETIVPAELAEIDESALFGPAALHRYRWDQTYTTTQYADLVRSYSNTNIMHAAARDALVAELCALADSDFGGSVTRPLVITLTLSFRT